MIAKILNTFDNNKFTMKIKQEILISILSFVFVLQLQSQNIAKRINNEIFTSKIGSICEETPDSNPCAGQGIYLTLKFNEKKIEITEMYISSCGKKSISYKLEYLWELKNDNEIKIHYKPNEVKYKSIENIKFKLIKEIIIGYKKEGNNKIVEYKFNKFKYVE